MRKTILFFFFYEPFYLIDKNYDRKTEHSIKDQAASNGEYKYPGRRRQNTVSVVSRKKRDERNEEFLLLSRQVTTIA